MGMMVEALKWCILRTSPGRTLPLFRSLVEAGMDAWTPVEVLKRRRPRSKITLEIDAPILPTFVFAPASHLQDLMRLAAAPTGPHPAFSVFRHLDRVPLIEAGQIEGIRAEEQRGRRKAQQAQRRTFAPGQGVSVPEGPFAGMSGIVQEGDGKFALVAFGDFKVKIATFLLEAEALEQTQPIPGVKPELTA